MTIRSPRTNLTDPTERERLRRDFRRGTLPVLSVCGSASQDGTTHVVARVDADGRPDVHALIHRVGEGRAPQALGQARAAWRFFVPGDPTEDEAVLDVRTGSAAYPGLSIRFDVHRDFRPLFDVVAAGTLAITTIWWFPPLGLPPKLPVLPLACTTGGLRLMLFNRAIRRTGGGEEE